jgi:hypothetical protein
MLVLENEVVEEAFTELNEKLAAGRRVLVRDDALVSHESKVPKVLLDLRIAEVRKPRKRIPAFRAPR